MSLVSDYDRGLTSNLSGCDSGPSIECSTSVSTAIILELSQTQTTIMVGRMDSETIVEMPL